MGNENLYRFLIGAIASSSRPTLKLKWKSETPVWVDQWPLPQEKLQHIQELVQEQLDLGHIRPSVSPWNTPIFTIQKKSGKWRLLHDLRAINEKMVDMGALQPGLPSPTMLPQNWDLLIIDLKDCFFTIPLHEDDCEKFAFTVPAINRAAPAKRYEWVVLPQGMKNSPTICQWFVDLALQSWRENNPNLITYHYMDDLLIASPHTLAPEKEQELIQSLHTFGLVIAKEKVQKLAPWNYLGLRISETRIQPQKILSVPPVKNLSLADWWIQISECFAVATLGIQLDNHYPNHPLFKTSLVLEEKSLQQQNPIKNALTVFTDASSKTQKCGYAYRDDRNNWISHIEQMEGSVQVLELRAVLMVFQEFRNVPLNVVSDSKYVVGIVSRLSRSLLGSFTNDRLMALVIQMWNEINFRQFPWWITHIRSHLDLPGVLSEGNAYIDTQVASPVLQNSPLKQATESHAFFHQSARSLQKQFGLSRQDARTVILKYVHVQHWIKIGVTDRIAMDKLLQKYGCASSQAGKEWAQKFWNDKEKVIERIEQCQALQKLQMGKVVICVVLGACLSCAQKEAKEAPAPTLVSAVEHAALKSENEVLKSPLAFQKETGEKLETQSSDDEEVSEVGGTVKSQVIPLRPLVKIETAVDDDDEIHTTTHTMPWTPAELERIREKYSRQPGKSAVEYVWRVSAEGGDRIMLSEDEVGDTWGPGVFLTAILGDHCYSLTTRAAYWAGGMDPQERGEPLEIRAKGYSDLSAAVRKAACLQAMYDREEFRKSPQLIASLPPGASIAQMIEACARAPLVEEEEKEKIHANALAVALNNNKVQGRGDHGSKPKCYQCGQEGHFKRDCKKNLGGKSLLKGNCLRCRKFGHKAADCRSKFRKDGTPLFVPGNGNSRVLRDAAKKYPQNPTKFMAASASCIQPPEEAQESIWPWQNL
ncbi:uncharacterized protein LOC121080446 [Falco naumanni]|uniref:uncharacterized protein LOC121080446 n=1 Tax=Falco naumanni TaxID=148594 RepID=UPI001ADE613F|nr:uncharacterized protein LOC121080446 [Falco naumanni]